MSIVLDGTTGITTPDINTTAQSTDIISTGDISAVDATLSGGVYLGGSGAANYLDDYEEGTWTPTIAGSGTNPTATYSHQTGKYVKVGNMVTVWCFLTLSSKSGGSGTAYVGGLPFTQADADDQLANSSVLLDYLAGDRRQVSLQGVQNVTYFVLIKDGGSTGSHDGMPTYDITANTNVRFVRSYFV